MPSLFKRHPANPIIRPGLYDWRNCVTFNPGVWLEGGMFYLYERTAGQLRPFHCYIGLLESNDGVNFRQVGDQPVWTPEQAGSKFGSVQDPRVVKIDDTYYMTYAFRPFACNYHPTGLGVPDTEQAQYPGFDGDPAKNMTRSGIAVSKDRVQWEHRCWPTPAELDDRDVILFPEKVDGRFALLRRPLQFVGPKYGTDQPGIWISFSKDLDTWSDPELLIKPAFKWEDGRIGGSTPPLRTGKGWLVFYHGVENRRPEVRGVIYRMGALLLDLHDPRKVLARTRDFLMEPEEYYEKTGLFIPNVVFPTGNVIKDGTIYLYYGVADTAIALATAEVDEVLKRILDGR
jgi:predicted GH43/DUF377 family glycosyl hydrolase